MKTRNQGQNVAPGVTRQMLRVELEEEGEVGIPYFILQGTGEGPTLYVQAGEHGIEVNGMAALHTFVRTFAPAGLNGRLVVVPVVNPMNLRYRHHTKYQPRGKGYSFFMPYNTYKRWPGKESGDPAQRICHAIATKLLPGVCGVINFHCWSWHSASCVLMSGYGGERERDFGQCLGNPFWLWAPASTPAPAANLSLAEYAGAVLGVPGCLFELRTHWWILPESHERALRAVRNACRFFGMRQDPYEPAPGKQFFHTGKTREALVTAPHDGLYVPRLPIEAEVTAGEILGDLYDTERGTSSEIVCPVTGKIWQNNRIGRQADVVYEDGHAFAEKGDLLALVKYG